MAVVPFEPERAIAHASGTQTVRGTGGIRGRLILQQAPKPNERRPEVSDPGAGAPRDPVDLRRGVVYLEQAPRSAFDEREPGRASRWISATNASCRTCSR